MPQVKITEEAKQDLARFADFLTENGALEQAKTVINVILQGLRILEQHPLSGRHHTLDGVLFRETLIKYGSSGYACLYSFDEAQNLVVIHALRHQREIGYSI
jgi:plasmid stabilization system protein ParE